MKKLALLSLATVAGVSAHAVTIYQTGFEANETPGFLQGALASGDAFSAGQNGWIAENYPGTAPLFFVQNAVKRTGSNSVLFKAGLGNNTQNWAYKPLGITPGATDVVTGTVWVFIESSTGQVLSQSYGMDVYGNTINNLFGSIGTCRIRVDGDVEWFNEAGQQTNFDLNLPTNNWHKISMVFDFATQIAKGFIDDSALIDTTTGLPFESPFTKTQITDFDLYARNRTGLVGQETARAQGYFDDFKVETTAGSSQTTVTGTVFLGTGGIGTSDQGPYNGNVGLVPITFIMKNAGGTILDTKTVTLTPQTASGEGTFSFQTTATGTFTITTDAKGWLAKKQSFTTPYTVELWNGDIDDDDSVTILDYSVLSDYFDTDSTNPLWNTVGSNGYKMKDADIDADDAVTILDYSILSTNFDKMGDL